MVRGYPATEDSMTSRNPLTHGKKQRALALLKASRFDEARPMLEKICATDRRDAEAWYLLGTLHEQTGTPGEAERCYRCAAELEPARAELHFALGNVQQAAGHTEQATKSYRRALAIRPDFLEAQGNLGAALESQGQLEEAVRCYEQACRLDPTRAELHFNRGNPLRKLGRHDEAVHCYRAALKLRADFPEALDNLGIALIALAAHRRDAGHAAPEVLELFQEAVEVFHGALRLRPDCADTYNNLAIGLRHLGRIEEAAKSYRRALVIDPQHTDAHEGLATIELLRDRFAEAWEHYRYRVSMRSNKTPGSTTKLPDDLAGQRLLAMHDQGLGDELFFLRFAPQFKRRGAYLMYSSSPKIASLLARVTAIDELLGQDDPAQNADSVFSIGDLPWLLGMHSAAGIPPALPLSPLPERMEVMRDRLAMLGKPPYIGVTWRAGDRSKAHVLYKECPLSRLAEALRPIPATILALQRHPAPGEIETFRAALGREVHDLSALNDDLESMLALLALLDDYVGVSNTNMHLRAGVNRTAKVLVPAPPEWRWMAEGKESPWFPGFTVYRQGYDGDWSKAFDDLQNDTVNSLRK